MDMEEVRIGHIVSPLIQDSVTHQLCGWCIREEGPGPLSVMTK